MLKSNFFVELKTKTYILNIYIYIYIYIYVYFIRTTISIEFTYQLNSQIIVTPDKRKAARDSQFVG